MNQKKKLIFISSIASPHQLKYNIALQNYFNAEFYFYDYIGERPLWWKIPLPPKCQVLKNVYCKKSEKYITFSIFSKLNKFNPDIIMIGGFSIPSNYFVYIWARLHKKKIVVFTERSRNKKGELRNRNWIWRLLQFLYRKIDLVIVTAEDTIQQFQSEFKFKHVTYCPYATDLEKYFTHAPREKKKAYTFLFPNRLIDIYNPLLAIDIFNEIQKKIPNSKLRLNSQGELLQECRQKINAYCLNEHVEFLSDIKSWDEMPNIYEECDILIFPAKFSNGNFTIIEAMASGMGVVISNSILGIGKLIIDQKNGFNCNPDVDSFLSRIYQYIDDPILFKKHAEINRKIVFPYTAESIAKQFSDLINSKL